ncbi:MAG: nucleotidyltransferase family protein [candidate division WWE3 bacterium]|nr:nucleotidyltransferase family protein [candidate division WWE3 bacterium]
MQLHYEQENLNKLCQKNQISYLGLFGSFARGEADSKSDIDLLVEFLETPSLLRHVGIEYDLSENIFNNRKVDLVTKKSLNKYISPSVLQDVITLYEKK